MTNSLLSINEVCQLIRAEAPLILAGDERILRSLPRGSWVGGTIPYFVGNQGGECSQEKIFVTEIPVSICQQQKIMVYDETTISHVYRDIPENSFGFLMIPATSKVHLEFALHAPSYEHFALSPLLGWITGVHLDELGKNTPKVFHGVEAESYSDKAICVHIGLSHDHNPEIGIINIFEQGNGDEICFDTNGFNVQDAIISGKKENLAQYLRTIKADTRLPLVADYAGAMVNVSFQDIGDKEVKFYAPIFQDVVYKIAKPIQDYVHEFMQQAESHNEQTIFFSCNCILNYLYSQLQGRKTGNFRGPATFGEIAYQLLNQTLVYIRIS